MHHFSPVSSNYDMMTFGEEGVKLHAFLTSALDGGGSYSII
jgi:hypothetical protein